MADADQFLGTGYQLLDRGIDSFFSEILTKAFHSLVVGYAYCPVLGIEVGKFVDEDSAVLIYIENLERFGENEPLDESGHGFNTGFIVHGFKLHLLNSVEIDRTSERDGVNLGVSPRVGWIVFTHVNWRF